MSIAGHVSRAMLFALFACAHGGEAARSRRDRHASAGGGREAQGGIRAPGTRSGGPPDNGGSVTDSSRTPLLLHDPYCDRKCPLVGKRAFCGPEKPKKKGLQRDWSGCIVDGSVQFPKEMCMALAASVDPAIVLSTAHHRPTRFT